MPPQQTVPRRRSLEAISVAALLITVVAAIFIVVPSPAAVFMTTKSFVIVAGAIITLALYILARLGRGNVVFPPVLLLGVLWLPAAAYVLSAVFSGVSFSNALWGSLLEPDTLGFILAVTFLGTLTALVLRRPGHYNLFLKVGAWSFGVLVTLQLLVLVVGQFAQNIISPTFSIIGSLNDLAFLFGLGVVSLLVTDRFVTLSARTRKVMFGVAVVALFLLAVVNAPVVWVLVALVSLGLFVEAVMRRRSQGTDADLDDVMVVDESVSGQDEGGHSVIMPLITLIASLFFLMGGAFGNTLAGALNAGQLNVRPSWQATLSVMRNAYSVSPVFGTGPNTFGTEWLKYRDPSLNSTMFWNLRFASGIGFIPTSAITAGFVGAAAWVAFLLIFIGIGLRTLVRRAATDPEVQFVSILSFVATVYLAAVALFDVPNGVLLALLFVFAGLFASSVRYANGSKQWGVIFSKSPRLGFVIVFTLTIALLSSVLAGYALAERYVATVQVARAAVALSGGDLPAAERLVQSSLSFAPSVPAYQVGASIAHARLVEVVATTTLDRATAQQAYQNALAGGINAALTATNLDPANVQSWTALGSLYAQAVPLGVSGAYDSAKNAYDQAIKLDPTNPQIHYTLAQLDIANKDTKAAKEELKAAIALKPDYTAAILLISQLEVRDGNVREALDAAIAAAYFTPNDPAILFQVGVLSAAYGNYAGAAEALSAAISVNPQFANARYFLSAVYAKQGDYKNALVEMQAIADLSSENASAVAPQMVDLKAGKNPFPTNLLTISPESVN